MEKKEKQIKVLASIDPSFTSTGLAIVDLNNKTIYTRPIQIGCPDKSFFGMQQSITLIVYELEQEMKKHDVDSLVHEEPFPGQMFSPALYGLDSAIFQTFQTMILHTYHPTILRKIHGGKYTKTDSKNLALKVLSLLSDYKYINNLSENKKDKKDMFGNKLTRTGEYAITSDESEAFLYAVTTLIKYGVDDFKCASEMLNTNAKGVIDWQPLIHA